MSRLRLMPAHSPFRDDYQTTSRGGPGIVAQLNLGVMYDNGRGAPKDYTEALRWFRLAAKRQDHTLSH